MSAENSTPINGEANTAPAAINWSRAKALGLGRERQRPLPPNLSPPFHYGPLFIGPVPPLDPVPSVVAWLRALHAIPPEHRSKRADYLLLTFNDLAIIEANRASIVARAILAAQQLADDDYWRETALWGREFKSGDELVRALLEEFGIAISPTRLRHQRSAARLYEQAESIGLPCPGSLGALEPFCRHGLAAYQGFVQKFGRPPSERSAATYCNTLDDKNSTKTAKLSPLQSAFDYTQQALEGYRERAQTSADPAFLSFFLELEACHEACQETIKRQKKTPRTPRPKAPDLPVYTGPTSPATFALIERDGDRYISVQMVALPDPCPAVLTRKPPATRGWHLVSEDDGRFGFERRLPANPSEANARWGEAFNWAVKACTQLGALRPEPPSPRP